MSPISLQASLIAVAVSLLAVLTACGSEGGNGTGVSGLETRAGARVRAAAAEYGNYVERKTRRLVAKTNVLVAAVIAGDIAKAKRNYAAARDPYERVEHVAESFGDLDARIESRENDVSPKEFGGFHRIERALWEEGTVAGMAPVAGRLLADVEELARKARAVRLSPPRIADGANELLGQVSALKVTGEEERHSHTDLAALEAGVGGAEAAVAAVEPLLARSDPALAREVEAEFDEVYAALGAHRRGNGFVSYEQLTAGDTRQLAQAIHSLAEKVSALPAAIAAAEASR